jgi:hypothetical protein
MINYTILFTFCYQFVCAYACFYVYVYLLDLSSIYERKHVASLSLSLAYFTSHDVLQLRPFTFKPHVIP